ncbi:basic helix-loop-helix ARNT-like protein 1 [Synchiropus splendidus]|uniref:basic helix-loop-helix ARNT-like protein 1 n=1 Tax=Synchiropus splendidus TaxID=270530 RepID=UPI00237EE86D|nr:basic helix-loop-helix ARNT-like protein 1 [Synchiropus splendidus]
MSGMSAGGSDGSAPGRSADPDPGEESPSPGSSHMGSSLSAFDLPRKRKGDMEERSETSLDFQMDEDHCRSEEEDQQIKMKCFREPHRQIEKRRRDKMNNLIDELSAMIPACQPMARKLDKLTVLRKAVQHLKALKSGTGASAFTDTTYKPSILPHDDLQQLLLRSADGFLLVVSCDRAKIIFISESVSKILNISRAELTGQSLLDYIHHKDINKVKEQLSSELYPRQRLIDASTGVQVPTDTHVTKSHLSAGARRSFFCRMKHCRQTGKHHDKRSMPSVSKKKDNYNYCSLHCTGYMRSWPSSQIDSEVEVDKDTSNLTCLVTLCRMQPHMSHQPPKDIKTKPSEFVIRCAIDGKFTFVDQQATTIIGYLPQEILGTSCYEYFHQEDLQHLAETHRQVLRTKQKIETRYRFKTKYGSYISLQNQWFSFTNPWTKEVEFIVALNRVPSGPKTDDASAGSSKTLQEGKQLPAIPGLNSSVGTMIYAGSIGNQIANEFIDSHRVGSSPSSGVSSPYALLEERSLSVLQASSQSPSSRDEASGSSSQSRSDSGNTAGPGRATSESADEQPQLELDNMVVPGLSSFSSDEAAMAVIMSLLETDANMGQSGEFEDLQWPF